MRIFLGITFFECYQVQTLYQLMCFIETHLTHDEQHTKERFVESVQQKVEKSVWWGEGEIFTQQQMNTIQEMAAASGISTQEAARVLQSVMGAYATHDDTADALKYLASSVNETSYLKRDFVEMKHRQQEAYMHELDDFKDRAYKTLADVKINLSVSVDAQALTDALAAVNHIIDGVTKGYVDIDEGRVRIQEIQRKIQK